MTLTSRLVVLTVVISVAVPQPATAGILSWLGRMSGPGPFIGIDISRCVAVKGGEPEDGSTGTKAGATQPTQSEGDTAGFIICPELNGGRRYRPHWTFYAVGGVSGSLRNPLQRGGADGHTVWVFNLGGAVDYTAAPWFAIGAGAGVNQFVGEDFKGFLRPYVEPYFSIRPALLGKRASEIPDAKSFNEAILRSFVFSVGWRVLFADLDGASFGAPADPWSGAHNEGRWSLSLGIDLSTIFDRKASRGY